MKHRSACLHVISAAGSQFCENKKENPSSPIWEKCYHLANEYIETVAFSYRRLSILLVSISRDTPLQQWFSIPGPSLLYVYLDDIMYVIFSL